MAFSNFCSTFINHFVDETDPATRFERFARLMVEEITTPGVELRYSVDTDAAVANLREALRPVLIQEGLLCIEPAFFGGISAEDTELLLEEFALFVEDPMGYTEPDLEQEDEDDYEQPAG